MARYAISLNPKYLEKGLVALGKIRPKLIDTNPFSVESGTLHMSGWLSREQEAYLPAPGKTNDPRLTIETVRKRQFKPGPFYVFGRPNLLFSGFKIKVRIVGQGLQFETLKSVVSSALGPIPFLEESSFSALPAVSPSFDRGGVETIRIAYSGFAAPPLAISMLMHFPDELITLVEASADKLLAAKLLAQVESTRFLTWGRLSPRHLLRLMLLMGENECNDLLPDGWKRVSTQELEWSNTAKFDRREPSMPEGFAKLGDAVLFSGGTIVTDSILWLNDETQKPWFDFVAGRSDHVVGSPLNIKECFVRVPDFQAKHEQIPQGILLSGRADFNWFHWLIEYLPRLFQIEGHLPSSVPILVSDSMPKAAYEALTAVTSRKIIRVSRAKPTRIGELIIPRIVIFHPDSPWYWLSETSNRVNSTRLLEFRNIVLERYAADCASTRDVLLVRTSATRGMLNQNNLVRMLARRGYEVIDPIALTFEEQVRIFASARNLVTVGGAVMAGFLFLSKNARVAILASSSTKDYQMPKILGQLVGAHVRVFSGRVTARLARTSLNQLIHSDFTTSKREMSKLVAFLGQT